MNVKIGTVTVEFLFWEYFFPISGIGSLQCKETRYKKYHISWKHVQKATYDMEKNWPWCYTRTNFQEL